LFPSDFFVLPHYIQMTISVMILQKKIPNVSLMAAYLVDLNEGFEVDFNGEFFADVKGGCDEGY
jgi:hypothetical protein